MQDQTSQTFKGDIIYDYEPITIGYYSPVELTFVEKNNIYTLYCQETKATVSVNKVH